MALQRNIQQLQQVRQKQQEEQRKRVQKFQDMIIENQIKNKQQQDLFQQQLKMLMNSETIPTKEGYSWSLGPSGLRVNFKPPKEEKEKKESATEIFRRELTEAKEGKLPWETLQGRYPGTSKTKEIEEVRRSTLPKISKSPTFKRGWGLDALFSRDIAKINPITQKAIRNIKNQEDLNELVRDREAYEAEGVDVNAILEYFGQRGKGNEQINFGRMPGIR